ncbi:uncharacterized protein LOC5568599 isoform X2 [Aedes aegypti]|uniref:Uncharacterized protein n=1 Tax=Aedes aegypti TaxID=7159 RepID=A0A6I8TJ51_AEDAE|nr:uncharacterized protein LOC5568599 isoform X2 [Aedes aegypti]
MSATSSISSTQSSSNSGNSGNNANSNSRNVLSSSSNIVILDNQILDSNDVVAAAGLQQLSGAGTGGLKLTRDCAVQYSNLISSYTASSNNNHGNATIVGSNSSSQMNTVNIIPGDSSQTNSRVQVLSNVQLVSSKGASQPSTFSYVDASGKNFNVLTSSGKISTNKLIGVPITKVKTFNHVGQQPQQHQLSSQQTPFVSSQMPQQQQQQQLQTQIGNVQKVTVPRNIQLVTRIPNSTISVSNGRMSQITPSSPQQQQQSAPQFTIQQYADSSGSMPSGLEIRSSVSGPIINSTNTGNVGKATATKSKNMASLKMMQNSQITQSNTGAPAKPVGKSMSVNLKSVRNNSKSSATGVNSQYYIKSSSNGTLQQQQQPGTTTSIYTTSPAQAVYHNPTPLPPQQSIQIPVSTTTTSGKGRGVYKTSKNQLIQIQQQQQQQQQPQSSPQRSITPSSPIGGAMPQNVTYGGGFGSTTTMGPGATSSSGVTFESSGPPSVTMAGSGSSGHHEHPIPSVTVTGYSSSTGKNKKYASTVQNESNSPGFVLSPVKMKGTGRGRNNSISHYQPSEATPYQRYSTSPSRPLQQQQHQPFQSASPLGNSGFGQHQHPSTSAREDQIFLNGQQMTDESSARILQSLSQRSTETGKYGAYKQQQFTFYGSENVPQLPVQNMPAPGVNNASAKDAPYDPIDARFPEDKSDCRRSSSSEIITYADNIPLMEGYPAKYDDYNHPDDNIIEEVRPAPVDVSNGRFHILQAVLQDHTYFAPSPELKLPDPQPPQASIPSQQTQPSQMVPTSVQHHPPPLHHHLQHQQQHLHPSSQQQHHYLQQSQSSQSLQQQQPHYKHHSGLSTAVSSTASAVMTSTSISVNSSIPSGVSAPLTQMSLSTLAAVTGSSASSPVCASTVTTTTPTTVQQQLPQQSIIPGSALDYIYQRQSIPPQDDDANSVISTGSRNYNNLDIDLGEETETAPEGEGEDDSVTRCICDLTHDDGYMICCDKCSAWQHVDCMGIDRANIPDEYNCEMCQPRPVDRIRARTLQMEKRKEQSLLLANNNLQIPVGDAAVTSTNLVGVVGTGPPTTTVGTTAKGANQYTTGKALAGTKKGKTTGSSKKKSSENAAAKKAAKKALDALNRVNGKRKELKKPSKKKIKTTEQNAEKMSNMIRTWIDNYERAITNHYSPELRARLTAFGKMQSQNPLLNSDRLIAPGSVINLAQKCTTVPHAGGKILISIEEIPPKTPIIEIRGKYMLSSQHKQLQSLFNMAANGKLSNNKNAGPFLFLYQVTQGGMELCVDTRTYGNDARFVRRSCRPNAEILHNVEKGVVHLYVVSTANIKANTEITIKHDEQLIQRVGGVVILTHTTVTKLCACGLIKDCQYSAQLSDGLLPAINPTGPNVPAIMPNAQGGVSSSTPPVPKAPKSKKNNGALGDGEKKLTKKRNSRSTSSNAEARLRSISSSGDSTSELMMYAQQQPPLSPLQPNPQFQPTPSQLVHQQLQQTAMHFMQQQQQSQPGLMQPSQPVYMYSPSPTHQSQPPALAPTSSVQLQPPVIHPQTPPPHPPMSPVMNIAHRTTGFYTEIKSPMNSPPPLNLTGPPPLVIPSMPSPIKTQSQHPPPLQPMSDVVAPPPPPVAIPMDVPALTIPNNSHSSLQDHTRMDLIQQQQQIMEDIIKIKIKSPKASPYKHEYSPIPSSTTTATTSMLSPPPPPPIPVAQRPRCAETLKQELFQSHYQPQVRSPSPAPPAISSPVKVEYTPPMEMKQEPQPIPEPQPLVIDEKPPMATEEDIKPEPLPEPELKVEEEKPVPVVKTEPEPVIEMEAVVKEEPAAVVVPPHEGDSKDGIDTGASLCDSATNSPTKSSQLHQQQTPGANPGNSAHSSPHSTSSQHHPHGGSSKKKNNPFKETETEKKEKPPSRKLTREERKMEAIVKAFEKMEQSQQRKQELKEQRKEGKRRSVSSSTPDESIPSGSSSTKKKSLSSQKRKKKKSKSLSQHFGSPNQSRKKKVSKSSKKSKNARVLALDEETPARPYENKAAELLLTFSQSVKPVSKTFFGDDVKPLADVGSSNDNSVEPVSSASSNLPLLSSACMLVEAAVGPLEQASNNSTVEQDFKFPQKAKTKKSMSREWLSGQAVDAYRRNTPDQDSGYMSEDKSHEYRRTPFEESSLTTPLGVDVSDPNICIVAKKVEEFIAQNSPQPEDVAAAGYKWEDKVSTSSTSVNNSQEQTHTPTSGGNVSESAAAKKRWLRQAISEETDELTQASSSPPPPNGFTTPLKKRRVIRQSDEVTVQPQPQQQQPTLLSAQKIDFADSLAPQHQQQPLVINSQQQFAESSLQWSNSGPPPLTYPFGMSEDKQAIDLSRTGVPPVRLTTQQQRIQPYKIVPIAQALTPLHFADPGPLPTPTTIPISIPPVQAHHHLIPMEPREIVRQTPLPPLAVQHQESVNHYERLPSPPPSAVAAMVPASLLPPEVTFVVPAEQQQPQQARIDVSYPSSAPVPGITRSKGSQKYIGSPAKFEPPSPSESLSSSVAETPEKNSVASSNSSGSLGNSDVDEDAHEEQPSKPEVKEAVQEEKVECPQAEMTMYTEQESVTATESSTTITSSGSVSDVNSLEPSSQSETAIVQEEQVITSEVVQEEQESSQMDESDTVMNSTEEINVSQVEDVSEEQTAPSSASMEVDSEDPSAKQPKAIIKTMNGREKGVPGAPEEDHDKNELEDLQKAIASFHSENIMNLISRNKKSKKVVTRENSSDDKPRYAKKSAKNRSNASSKEGSVTPPAPPSPPPEEQEVSDPVVEPVIVDASSEVPVTCEPEPEPVPAPVPPPVEEPSLSTLGRSYSHPSWHATDTFRDSTEVRSYSTLRPDIPQINYNSPSTYQSKAARELLSSLSAGSEPLSSFTSFRTSTSSFLDYPKSSICGSATVTSNSTTSNAFQYKASSEISSLLDKGFSSTRPSSFSTLGPDRSTERVGSSYLLSSTKVTDNLSTLGSTSTAYPKIFTKTASSDPRLNPALTTPEPPASATPKRKLSINEYRQRKMQSCSNTTPSPSATSSVATSTSATTAEAASSSSSSSSSDSGGSNQISSSLGSNDVSSSICKELELELELGEEKPSGDDAEAKAASSTETSGSKAGTTAKPEISANEATV